VRRERLQWFQENIEFFDSIDEEQLSIQIPNCPGWTLIDLLKHLSFGLGVCYPIAAAAPPAANAEAVFANADRSSVDAQGREAVAAFRANMAKCLSLLSQMDPEVACWTYAGPGTVSFWIRRAAAETAIHRYDAEVALGISRQLAQDRADDGIDEALEFALPFASRKIGAPSSALHIKSTDSPLIRSIGSGEPAATLVGDSYSLLLKLWGRDPLNEVEVQGDKTTATDWLTLVSRAFAGR